MTSSNTTGTPVTTLPPDYSPDFIIVGGGTAGCIVASRLAEYLPDAQILLVEAGPSDYGDDRVLNLRNWLSLLGGEFDYEYTTTEQVNGNSNILHSRAKVLGGCSSHNTLISFAPLEQDLKHWESLGATSWTFPLFQRLISQLRTRIQPIHPMHRNQLVKDWVRSCSISLGIPVVNDWNKHIDKTGKIESGVGFFSLAYEVEDGVPRRSSASVAYLHDVFAGKENKRGLTVLVNAWVGKLIVEGREKNAKSLEITFSNGERRVLSAKKEVILCGGAIDTPRLFLLSGIGPSKQLEDLGIDVVHDLPGVGENLLDHPETIIIWELNGPMPEETSMHSDAGIFIDRDGDGVADLMMHTYQIPFCVNTARLGYDVPEHAFCMTPNIPRPKSKGRLYLTSSDPVIKPALDFRYFTDPEGYDAKTLVDGIRIARKVAKMEPFKSWLKREVAPGIEMTSDDELSEYARRAAHTVYHPAGTTKMGNKGDRMAVVDETLRVRGLEGVRIADAGVFPDMVTVNPMVTVLVIGERCAELVAETWGWRRETRAKL
ncbi:hypothetical protein RUND412_008814 [Rhizina undulata]